MLLFDTGKKLEKAVGEEAAQITIEAFEKLDEEQKKELATKGDLRESEMRLQLEIEKVRNETEKVRGELKTNIEKVRSDLLRWQFGIGIALALIMATGFGWLGF